MALPSVTVQISEDSFQVSSGEAVSTFYAGAVLSGMTLINALGTTAEVNQKYMVIPSIDNLWSRLNLNSGNGSGEIFDGFSGGQGAEYPISTSETRWPKGPTGDWKTVFYTLETVASYGAQIYAGTTSSNPFSTSDLKVNCIFDADGSSDANLSDILTNRSSDVLAIHSTIDKGATANPATKYHVFVYGTKEIIPRGSSIERETELGGPMQIPLSADLVGCLARTFRIAEPWYSPAGFTRGTINNVYRLVSPLTASEANTLYNNKVNPVLSFPNEGVLLFGDKTGGTERIGEVNLILYLQEQIGIIARQSLFEINNTETRLAFVNRATSVLQSVQNRFGITEYSVTCNETNNTPEVIANGDFVANITYKPLHSIKTVSITFTSASEDQILTTGE